MSTYPNNSSEKDQLDHNTKWCDIDVSEVYQFDHQPSNVIQVGTSRQMGIGASVTANGQYNNLYQMTRRLQNKQLASWQSWMNWVEKIQPDYKFLTVCQTNAQTCVFANVDDPWMFTEYIYKGTGKYYDPTKTAGQRGITADYVVIQPALYNWSDLTAKNKSAQQRQIIQTGEGTLPSSEKDLYYHQVNSKGWWKQDFGEYLFSKYTTGADGCGMYKVQIPVQCVKWGQHGNIPPHSIDTMAPAKFLQSATKMTLKTIKKPTVGVPLYHNGGGVFQQKGDKLYVKTISFSEKDSAVTDDNGYITKLATYTGVAVDGEPLETPQTKSTKYGKVVLSSTQRVSGQLLFNGCKYFKKLQTDTYGCALDSDFTQKQRNKAYCVASSCTAKNTKCSYFTKAFNLDTPMVIVARYEIFQKNTVDNDVSAQNANIQMQKIANSCLITGTAAGVNVATAISNSKSNYSGTKQGSQVTITYETSYQMVQQPVNGIQVYIPQNAQNYRGAKVTRGTGQSAFQQAALTVRTIYNNDTSQINFTRWLNQVAPCYQRKFCNETIGLNAVQKKNGYSNCGVDYKVIGDNNQIITKNSGFCPYYSYSSKYQIGCPYNAINKTARDFALHNNLMYQNLYIEIASPIAIYFASHSSQTTYENQQIKAQKDDSDIITVYYKDMGTKKRNFANDDLGLIFLSSTYGIQQQVLTENHSNNLWTLCKIKYTDDGKGGIKKYKDQYILGVYVKYYPYTLGSYTDGTSSQRLKDSSGNKIQWVIKVQRCDMPKRDPIFVDNESKFVGGYHPQYLAYPASPDQILYKKQQAYQQQNTLDSKADASQFGQTSLAQTKQVQYGYFVLQTGNWVLDGQSIGNLVSDQDLTSQQCKTGRAQSPTASYQGGIALHDRWQNSKIDPQADEPQQKQIKNCVIYSNDTKTSIEQLRKNPPVIPPQDQDGDQKKIPPRVLYPQYLPRQRTGCQCSTCSTTLALRFYKFGSSTTTCPWCGKDFIKSKPMNHFPRTKAMGRVSIWGLPGTIIKTDTYFWKSQVKVNNALIDQMCFKLGVKNNTGGGYTKSSNSKDSQSVDRVPYSANYGKYTMDMTQDLYKYISSVSSVSNSSLSQQTNLVMVNPNIAKSVVTFGGTQAQSVDNRVINPFTTDYNGLKMVTVDYISAFRNRLQPTFAYIVGRRVSQNGMANSQTISANGQYLSAESQDPSDPSEYQMYRVKYDERRQLSLLKKWVKLKSVVNNVILAYAGPADAQAQAYVQYPVGDEQQWYWAKKYYPPDPHWWYNKGYVGGIGTDLSGNYCHIDRKSQKYPCYRWNYYTNLQTSLQSSVFLCIHGYVPADKLVAACYLIQPGSQCSCDQDPVGQFQFPSSNVTRVAYNHYHSFTKSSEHQSFGDHVHADSGNFQEGDKQAIIKNFQNDVCSDGSIVKCYVDKYGDKYYIDDQTGIPTYQRKYKNKYKNKFLSQTQDVHLSPWSSQNLPYLSILKQVNVSSVLSGLCSYHQTHIGDNAIGYGAQETDQISWDGFGTDIVQKQSQNSIWKQYTTEQFQQYQEQYRAQIQYDIDFGDGDVQTASYTQYYSAFNNFISQQMQNIPGYTDMSGYNSSGLLPKYQSIKEVDTNDIQGQYQDFVIVQSQQKSKSNSSVTQQSNQQAGQSDKAYDITTKFKKLYYKRMKVGFTATMGDKSLDDLKTLQASKWTGTGSNTNATDMTNYNKRISTTNGYLLNANYWLPKTEEDNSAIDMTQYEKIQIQTGKIYYTTKKQQYYTVTNTDTISVVKVVVQTKNGETSSSSTSSSATLISSDSSDSSSTIDISSITSALQQCGVDQVSDVDSNIIINADQNTTYTITTTFGMSFQFTSSYSNRIISYTGYTGNYHPYYLTNYYPTQSVRAWKTSTTDNTVQTCIIDLYHTPRQKQRRNYRAQAGHVDYSSAKCTNSDCEIGKQTQTVSVYAKNHGITFSSLSSTCPSCGKELSGSTTISGDGIDTYIYDDLFETDQIIRQLSIQLTQKATEKVCPFSIFVSSDLKQWQCIFSGIPDTSSNTKYRYSQLYTTGTDSYTSVAGNTLTNFVLKDLARGRYLKIAISPMPQNKTIKLTSITNNLNSGYLTYTDSLTDVDDGGLNASECKIYLTRTQKNGDQNVTKSYAFNATISKNTQSKLYINSDLIQATDTINQIWITAKLYKTCFAKLKVGGVSYSDSQITITPKPTTITYDYDSQGVLLNYLPIQFFKVSVLINDSAEIILSQIMKYDDIDTGTTDDKGLRFIVDVVTQSFTVYKRDYKGQLILDSNGKMQYETRTIKYYEIKSGNYYFDVARKKIMLPRYYYCATNIIQVDFGDKTAASANPNIQPMQKDSDQGSYYKFSKSDLTYNLKKWGITKQLIPTKTHAVIWSGMQGGLSFDITADGRGPAYQVQKGAIAFIDTELPDNGNSTPLPNTTNTYTSYAAVNQSTAQKTIPWIVYNNQVITQSSYGDLIKKQGKFVVTYNATDRTSTGQDWFVQNIMGQHCCNALGICSGQVTLKGRPNTILKGNLKVHAAAITKRNFCGDIVSYQLTGGFSQQGVLVSPKVKKQKNRAALAYGIPYLLVYLKQKSPMYSGSDQPQYCSGYGNTIQTVTTSSDKK